MVLADKLDPKEARYKNLRRDVNGDPGLFFLRELFEPGYALRTQLSLPKRTKDNLDKFFDFAIPIVEIGRLWIYGSVAYQCYQTLTN